MTKSPETTPHVHPQIGDQVYAYLPDSNPPIKKGVARGSFGSDTVVRTSGKSSLSFTRVHKSHVFTPLELASASMDLLPSPDDGEEVHISKSIEDILAHPLATEELSMRLGVKALEKYMTTPRTPEELGLHDTDTLLGDSTVHGTNRWKVDELTRGLKAGRYKSGGRNELDLCAPTQDLETLPVAERKSVIDSINETNRKMLDTLYDEYEADFTKALVYERSTPRMTERSTVIPAGTADFAFIETTYIPNDGSEPSNAAAIHLAQIATGQDDYYTLDNGYLPAV